jgi:hypothetical protein
VAGEVCRGLWRRTTSVPPLPGYRTQDLEISALYPTDGT